MRRWHWIAFAALTMASLVAEFSLQPHGEHWWNSIPAFYLLFGFVGCIVIIFFSKALGKYLLQKREDYYDGN